ncbi:MAG: hypothetical protein JWQ48_375 [Conexibacter sp.]|nr:hypothetical protein [Conexibacter sp.]
MKTSSWIVSLACAGALSLGGVAQAATPSRSVAAAPAAHTTAIGTDIAGAFAAKLATSGASYLIGQLQGGALGGTGKSIGDFLSSAGLGDPNAAVLAEFKAVNARLDTLQQSVGELGSKIDQLAASQANNAYSNHVAHATKLRSAVLTGEEKLRQIAAAPIADRPELAAAFVKFYNHNLADNQKEFEHYLTGGGVAGADGIFQLASKRSRSAAQPFFTATMSEFPRQVWQEYTLIQAVWLQETLNVLAYERASEARIVAAIAVTKAEIDREWATIPPMSVFPNTVIDVRTSQMWSWRVDGTPCADHTTARTYNTCIYARGAHASKGPWSLTTYSTGNVDATNGSPGSGWARPTISELQKLDSGASGAAVPGWLHATGGFPAAITGEVWTSAVSGNNATTVNQSSGATASRAKAEAHYSLLTGAVDTRPGWYWLH